MLARFSLPILLLAAGCVSTSPDDQKNAGTATAQATCQREYRVGSNIPVKDCAPALSEEERQRMIDELRQKARPAGSPPPGG